MQSKEEIEKVLIQNELDEQLAAKIDKVFETINAEQIKYGELSQFNKDICFIFDALLNREPKEKLTATEILIKNQNNYIQNEKERHIKNKIEQLEAERTEVISYMQRMIVMTKEAIKNLADTKYYYERQEMKTKLEVYEEILKLMKGE